MLPFNKGASMAQITFNRGKFSATKDGVTITTRTTTRGLPKFSINQNLFKVFPHTREAVMQYILTNHKPQPITAGDTYRKHGRCWIPTSLAALDSGYCNLVLGGKMWGFVISGMLHAASYMAFGDKDITEHSHHKCHVTCCCRPDHIFNRDQSTHQKIHVAEREEIEPHQLHVKNSGYKKITNPMALLLRDLTSNFGFNHDLLAFALNCSESTIGHVTNRVSHQFINEEHEETYKRLSSDDRKRFQENPIHDKLILNGKKIGLKMAEVGTILRRNVDALYARKKRLKEFAKNDKLQKSIQSKHKTLLRKIETDILETYHTRRYGYVVELMKKYEVNRYVIDGIITRLKKKGLL